MISPKLLGICCLFWLSLAVNSPGADPTTRIDFKTEIRPLLSNRCFACHGPDEAERQAGLRLDRAETAIAPLDSGTRAIVPGDAAASEMFQRIISTDPDLRMPPPRFGKALTESEQELIRRWIEQGAEYSQHWSYIPPVRPAVPALNLAALPAADQQFVAGWPKTPIDLFILDRLIKEGLTPQPEADRYTLIRRVTLDLTGLPPTPEEVEAFVNDADPRAYERLVDRLLQRPAYGEHWARKWLDLARYADSAGYADDPPRTIWAYRDWVIRALNDNLPFDEFTVQQMAGDLLPEPTEDQLIATAFHRNTLTNNEGGTSDEEFRNVAVVDRVNTTFAVWMGTTMACAQCHSHKYDPISQEDYFKVFAIFNNTADADRRDEAPTLDLYTAEQREQSARWREELTQLELQLQQLTPELVEELARWEASLQADLAWQPVTPSQVNSREGAPVKVDESGRIQVGERRDQDVLTLDLAAEELSHSESIRAIRLVTVPDASLPGGGAGYGGGNFVVTGVRGLVLPGEASRPLGQFVRISIPGRREFLSLAEVEVFSGGSNVARTGQATQSSVDYGGTPERAIDGNTSGKYTENSTTHTAHDDAPWWEVDLLSEQPLDQLRIWNRTDGNVSGRLKNFEVQVLNAAREVVWETRVAEPPAPDVQLEITGVRSTRWSAALADFEQSGFPAASLLAEPKAGKAPPGWAVAGQLQQPHQLTLMLSEPLQLQPGARWQLTIEQLSPHAGHTLGSFRLEATGDPRAEQFARLPQQLLAITRIPAAERTAEQAQQLQQYFLREVSALLAPVRQRRSEVQQALNNLKPATSVPIFRELPAGQRRTTRIQHRGNFLDLGDEVSPGVPAEFHPLPEGAAPDRLGLARWLVDPQNPLTARVIANRYWENLFERGLVATSEEFGSQGDLPSHPELLDWLATELIALRWNTKEFLKLLVLSAAYRQQSTVTPQLLEHDPENALLARGPRVRLTAEMIRDQALAVSGLLSCKMYGEPVRPFQPNLGLSAAFGSGIDWQQSAGEDRYRRGIYTTWRRSNPYPSMVAFDAPNREVCTVRRGRTNTPLQALVTLNDPVYIEAAQALARRIMNGASDDEARLRYAVLLCLARPVREAELEALLQLRERAARHLAGKPQEALQLATNPLGPLPEGADPVEYASWTAVANVLLNLDEVFLKP
jgi:hypothetical protein